MNKKFNEILIPMIQDKKVVIYGYGIQGGTAHFILHRLGYPVSLIADKDEKKHGTVIGTTPIISPYDLMYEDADSMHIFICTDMGRYDAINTLESMGFVHNVHFSTIFLENRFAPLTFFDPHLGWSRGDGQIVSQAETGEVKILTLGGSTTDNSFNGFLSWPAFLQKELNVFYQSGSYIVKNGGVSGYCSNEELFELIEYGIAKENPNLVISYSGYNDSAGIMQYKCHADRLVKTLDDMADTINQSADHINIQPYYGEKVEDYAQLWISNMRMMHGICKEFGIKFISVLQPNFFLLDKMDEVEFDICHLGPYKEVLSKIRKFYSTVHKYMSDFSWMYDFTHLFDNNDKVFIDACHVYEEGNRIIAQEICKVLQADGYLED